MDYSIEMELPKSKEPDPLDKKISQQKDQGCSDETTERRANERLKVNVARMKMVLDNIPQIAFVIKCNGEDIYLNKKWTEYTGKHWKDGIGMKWTEVVYPGDLPSPKIWTKTKEFSPVEFEYRLRNKFEEYRWHLCRALPVKDKDGFNSIWIGTATDIHDKKEVELQLKQEKYFIEQIAQATPDVIAIYNIADQVYTYITDEVIKLLGISPADLKNLSAFKPLIHPRDWQKFIDFHHGFEFAKDQESREFEFRIKAKEGNWIWLSKKGKAFKRSESGIVSHVVTITQDITVRKEAEEKQKQNLIMKELLEKKDEFLSEASHELKTPITTIKSSLQIMQRLLEKHTDEATLLVFLIKANQQVNKLTDLIGNIMDNSKIQAGKFVLHISSFSMSDLINDVLIHNPGKHKISVENNVKSLVEADKHRIEQVLINFLTNAVKYSPEAGEITIRAEQHGKFLKVSVQDFGIGIPKDSLKRIFKRFFRVDDTSVRFSGLGLGLYISAEIIKHHHGQIGVESIHEKGSTFWFTIPLEQSHN